MRIALLSLSLIVLAGCAGPPRAPSCDALVLDLERGALSGVAPTASPAAFQAAFPCATGETEEGGPYNFGGGVFYLNHDFYAYTFRDFIEAREDFAGRTVPDAVLGSSASQADAAFGTPQRVEDGARLYDRRYGCLRIEVVGGAIREVGVHAQTCAEVEVPR